MDDSPTIAGSAIIDADPEAEGDQKWFPPENGGQTLHHLQLQLQFYLLTWTMHPLPSTCCWAATHMHLFVWIFYYARAFICVNLLLFLCSFLLWCLANSVLLADPSGRTSPQRGGVSIWYRAIWCAERVTSSRVVNVVPWTLWRRYSGYALAKLGDILCIGFATFFYTNDSITTRSYFKIINADF